MKIFDSKAVEYKRNRNAMVPNKNGKQFGLNAFWMVVALLMIFTLGILNTNASSAQKDFGTTEEAVAAFIAALRGDNEKELLEIFGMEEQELISSGDPVADQQRQGSFIREYDIKNSLFQEGEKMVLIVGDKDWPFPIPLVKKGGRWSFNTKAGKEEILNRRIGENEASTMQTLLAIVDAQREYAMKDYDGDGTLEYAEKFWSDPGKKNGLFWETKEGEEPSPLGELVASARAEGYTQAGAKKEPMPYHGYFFRPLKKQGRHASGGAFDYMVKGKQIGGFAVIAYPSTYGNSGVMTFVVNYEGVIYEKNLGKNTANTAKALDAFDPDASWEKIDLSDSVLSDIQER